MDVSNVVKKKRVIILFIIFAFLMMVVIGILLGNLVYKCVKSPEQQTAEVNILNLEETIAEKKEENEVLFVELENNTSNSSTVNSKADSRVMDSGNTTVPKKQVDIPYYIKVNVEANVVTVYKKDGSRKLHSALQSNDLFRGRGNTSIWHFCHV